MRGGLSAWQQRTVAEYIDEHVDDNISLLQLARLAGLSPYHFARAFKQAHGACENAAGETRRVGYRGRARAWLQ
jgi:AraC family transcriptional regulator